MPPSLFSAAVALLACNLYCTACAVRNELCAAVAAAANCCSYVITVCHRLATPASRDVCTLLQHPVGPDVTSQTFTTLLIYPVSPTPSLPSNQMLCCSPDHRPSCLRARLRHLAESVADVTIAAPCGCIEICNMRCTACTVRCELCTVPYCCRKMMLLLLSLIATAPSLLPHSTVLLHIAVTLNGWQVTRQFKHALRNCFFLPLERIQPSVVVELHCACQRQTVGISGASAKHSDNEQRPQPQHKRNTTHHPHTQTHMHTHTHMCAHTHFAASSQSCFLHHNRAEEVCKGSTAKALKLDIETKVRSARSAPSKDQRLLHLVSAGGRGDARLLRAEVRRHW